MNGVPGSMHLRKETLVCPNCGSTSRVGRGLCLSCLLSEGLRADTRNGDALEEALGEINVRDAEWRLGNYQILEEIGRGAIGIVYRAREQHSARIVALKRILPYHAESHETLLRFRREAQTAASLDHPNILPIHEIGETDDGLPFFTMKFAAGGNLLDAAPELRSEPRRAVAVIAKVARALQYAHSQGILHRDLKPQNILLDGRGEPLVSDFGLTKCLEPTSNVARTLTVFGAPDYTAPEQVDPGLGAGRLTPAADVYSAGAILFYLLTGRPPFVGESPLKVLQQVAEKPAPKLRTLAPMLDRDLESICAKCLEREPNARYHSAGDMADDLERWLEGQPVALQADSAPRRLLRWSRRHPILAAVTAGLLALGVATGWMLWKSKSGLSPEVNGIAVLPFDSSSPDKEDVLFADAIQDDILTRLAKISDLKVISRTSVMQYRDKRDVREIGRTLGVSHVLDGSASKMGNRFQLKVRLIDTRTRALVWAENYDRNLDELFAVESDAVQKVAQQLHSKISSSEKRTIAEPLTTDLTAFNLYHRAKELLRIGLSSSLKTKLLEGVELLNQAVARDPSFHQAYCLLAFAHDQLYFLGFDHSTARLAAAEAAVQQATRLLPDAGETHIARAQHFYWAYLDFPQALTELEAARKSLPNDPRTFQLMGFIQRREGRWEESIENLGRSCALDPRNIETLQQIALSYGLLHRYDEERAVLRRALAIDPTNAVTRVALAAVEFHEKSDTLPLHQTIESIQATMPAALREVANDWLSCALAERDIAAARKALDAFGEAPLTDYAVHLNRSLMEGVIARMSGDAKMARLKFTAARAEQEKIVETQPDYGPALCALGLIDAALGRKNEALEEGRRAVALLPPQKDAVNGPLMRSYLALIAAWVGEKDLACQELTIAVRPPGTISYGQLKLLPFWDPLRNDPRFEQIVASLAPVSGAQSLKP